MNLKKILIIALTGIALLPSVFPLDNLEQHVRESWNADLATHTFTVGGKQYRVTEEGAVMRTDRHEPITNKSIRGEVLALTLFYVQTNDDPLLYAPDLNVIQWNKTVGALSSARTQFLANSRDGLSANIDYALLYPAALSNPEALYPLAFLTRFAKATALQESFWEQPSDISARKLLAAQADAARAYYRSARFHTKMLDSLADSAWFIRYIGSAADIAIFRNDFALITKNGQELQKEIAHRSECVRFGSCTYRRNDNRTAPPVPSIVVQQPTFSIPLEFILPGTTEKIAGPYLITTNCLNRTISSLPAQVPMYLSFGRYDGLPTALPFLADDNFYWDARDNTDEVSRRKVSLGQIYNNQAVTNTYMCNDNSFYPNILTLASLQDDIAKEGVITSEETYLLRSKLPSDEILPALSAAYEKLDTAHARHRKMIVDNRLAHFDLVLGKLNEFMRSYANFTYINKEPYPLPSLLGERSSYSLLYLPFARSVWRIADHPRYLLSGIYQTPNRFMDWKTFVSRGLDARAAHIYITEANQKMADEVRQEEMHSLFAAPGGLLPHALFRLSDMIDQYASLPGD